MKWEVGSTYAHLFERWLEGEVESVEGCRVRPGARSSVILADLSYGRIFRGPAHVVYCPKHRAALCTVSGDRDFCNSPRNSLNTSQERGRAEKAIAISAR